MCDGVINKRQNRFTRVVYNTTKPLFNRHTTANLPHKPNLAPNSYHIHAAVTRLHSLASTDIDTYMDRQTDTLG